MTPKSLKRLSKRAAPLLAPLGDHRQQFRAEKLDNYCSRSDIEYPLKGTIMVGDMVGYYEPEWEEDAAWGALCFLVHTHFTDWSKEDAPPTRTFRYPSDMLQGARDIISGAAP